MQVGTSWLYLACVVDMHSRRVLGWSMASHMRAELVTDALRAAVATRGGDVTGVIPTRTADRGSRIAIHIGRVRAGQRQVRHPLSLAA
ncbi:DDE-type integrase/transposase/recombinase [Streptomyces sp. ACA25]|nr:DDE-type integrase/transposase/recombinase [Streptomyces sp. ACA25]MDB1090135.1 DDE-type integrase/transposase/recombinase [Streptomyces sp. ACA25]